MQPANNLTKLGRKFLHPRFGNIINRYLSSTNQADSANAASQEKVVTLVPGDGVGPELVSAVKHVFKSSGDGVKWDEVHASDVSFYGENEDSMERIVESMKRTKVGLKAPITVPMNLEAGSHLSLSQKMACGLDLYANVTPVKNIPGLTSRHKDVDMVVIREQTEGEYTSLEHESVPGVVEMMKIITAEKSRRIARFAFDFAVRHNRQKVTCVHKANIMKLADGLFLRSCQEVAKDYPQIKFEGMIVDNTAMQLVSNPQQFDVVVLPNLYGSIVDNIGAGLVGGPGVVPARSVGAEYAFFEPGARHTFATAAGTNTANPTALLLASCDLLDHIGLTDKAGLIRTSVYKTILEGENLTMDMGGSAPTNKFVAQVIKNL